jgi:peptidyl-prolyl cis-trans isomerase D
MFEFVRTHKKWMQILLALIILPSFVLVGVSSMTGGGAGGAEVATVGDEKITQQQWEEAQRNAMDRARASQGARFDPKQFESDDVKKQILDDLIAKRVLAAEVKHSMLTTGTAAVKQQVEAPYIGTDGKVNVEAYKAMLTYRGMSEAQLFQSERDNMTLRQLNVAIEATAFVPRAVSNRVTDAVEEEREVQELIFPVADYLGQVKVSDEMVKAYYEKHAALFQAPEQVKIEYVVMDPAVVESQIVVSDAEIADFYANNKGTLGTPEQRYTSHILIAVKKDASAADKAAAKAKAEAILADVRKAPATFADVAKTQSQDPESAAVGGELGLATKGSFIVPELEAAAYKLKQGEFELVSSEFGYHVLTVNKLVPGAIKPLDEIKPKVVAELKKAKLPKKYAELAEKLTNTVYEQADSLKPAADLLHVQIQTAENLSRLPSQSPALANSPVNHPKFLKAIFADDAIKNKRNTEAVETVPNTMVSGRIVEYKPAAKRPLAEVEPAIRMIVARDEAGKLARKAGEAKLAAVKASGDAAGFGEAKVDARTKQSPLPEPAMLEVRKADVAKLPAYVGADLPGIGFGIYRINKVSAPAKPDPARRSALAEQINGVAGQSEMISYVEALKVKAKTKLMKPVVTAAK